MDILDCLNASRMGVYPEFNQKMEVTGWRVTGYAAIYPTPLAAVRGLLNACHQVMH